LGTLKVIGWMTIILPLLAYVGACIFHAYNTFQEKQISVQTQTEDLADPLPEPDPDFEPDPEPEPPLSLPPVAETISTSSFSNDDLGPNSFRNYNRKISKEENTDIQFIINTLGKGCGNR